MRTLISLAQTGGGAEQGSRGLEAFYFSSEKLPQTAGPILRAKIFALAMDVIFFHFPKFQKAAAKLLVYHRKLVLVQYN